jgi:hypothetical protein
MTTNLQSHFPRSYDVTLPFLLVLRVQKRLSELTYVFMTMRVTDDPVNGSSNISASDIADDGDVTALQASEPGCVRAQPIMVLDRRFDPAVRGNINTHSGQGFSRVPQEIEIFRWRALPEMKMKRFIPDDGRAG